MPAGQPASQQPNTVSAVELGSNFLDAGLDGANCMIMGYNFMPFCGYLKREAKKEGNL